MIKYPKFSKCPLLQKDAESVYYNKVVLPLSKGKRVSQLEIADLVTTLKAKAEKALEARNTCENAVILQQAEQKRRSLKRLSSTERADRNAARKRRKAQREKQFKEQQTIKQLTTEAEALVKKYKSQPSL